MIRRTTRTTHTDTICPYTTLFRSTDINGQRQRLTTRRFYLRNDAARGFAIEIGDHHFGSLGGEPLRRRQPNAAARACDDRNLRSEEHPSELQSLMRISYAVFCLTTQTSYSFLLSFFFSSLFF